MKEDRCIYCEDAEDIRKITAYIKENLDSNLTIPSLARKACMSESKFKYCFKRVWGTSVHSYITSLRIDHAKALLAQTRLPISGIAKAVGYIKPGAFAKAFRKRTGRLPREFREEALG